MSNPQRIRGRWIGPAGLARDVCLFTLCVLTLAAGPATKPASKVSDEQLRQSLNQLDSLSPLMRVEAHMALLKLSRSDLPRLRQLVEQSQPLSPSQVQCLFDVVTHVYLTGESYPQMSTGFLGMGMAMINDADNVDASNEPGAVVVQSRMPGLAAYSALLEGDVILRFAERPQVVLSSPARLIRVVSDFRQGDTLHIQIRRQGRELTVPVTLVARPSEQILDNIEEFNDTRLKLAEKYWEKNFGSFAKSAYSWVE